MIAAPSVNATDELEIGKEEGTFAPVRHSGLGIRFRFSVFTVFPGFKDFHDILKHNNNETNAKRKISAQPIMSSSDHAQNYPKNWGKSPKLNKNLKQHHFQ